MHEDNPGTPMNEKNQQLPDDAVSYAKVGSWDLYLSQAEQSLIVDTTDYHPGLLHVTKADLQEILSQLDG